MENLQTAMNTKTEKLKFLVQKPNNRSKKIAKTAKPKIPMPPSTTNKVPCFVY